MSPPHSMLATLILGFPIVGVLFLVVFRLDELIAKPRPRPGAGHPLSHWDQDGQVVCIEPDGRYLSSIARADAGTRPVLRCGYLPRAGETRRGQRIWVEWEEIPQD